MNNALHPPLLNKPARPSAAPAIWSLGLAGFAWMAFVGLVGLFRVYRPAADDTVMRSIVGVTGLLLLAALLGGVVLALLVLVRHRAGRLLAVLTLILAIAMAALVGLSLSPRAQYALYYATLPSDQGARAAADPARRGLTKFDGSIIDAHAQRGETCVPSSVEMVLKLLGRVPLTYYEQQDKWKIHGSFQNFDGKTFNGVTFRLQFWLPRDDHFPLEKLFAAIRAELRQGRFVIVGLEAPPVGWHNWVIYDEDLHGEFLAVSKSNAKTICIRDVRARITKMKGTDIGTYELQVP